MQVTGKLPTSNPEQSSSKKAEPQQDFQESCHRRMHDPITGKTPFLGHNWKRKQRNVVVDCCCRKCLVCKIWEDSQVYLSKNGGQGCRVCLCQCFSQLDEDEESNLWWVSTGSFTEQLVPLCYISKPLVTAKDDDDINKLWILNYRSRLMYM